MARVTVVSQVEKARRMFHAAEVEDLIQNPLPVKKQERFRTRRRKVLKISELVKA